MQEQKLLLDKKAFKEIFNDFYQPLCHLSQYYLEDKEAAKDVVEDAFVKLWEIRSELNSDSNLQNLLFTIVKNNSLNLLKIKQIRLVHHDKIRETELRYQYECLSGMNSDYLELDELMSQIDSAINKLPEHYRIVFEKSRFEEKKNREIAEELGVSVKTVEARMTQSLKLLREELKDYLPLIVLISKLF